MFARIWQKILNITAQLTKKRISLYLVGTPLFLTRSYSKYFVDDLLCRVSYASTKQIFTLLCQLHVNVGNATNQKIYGNDQKNWQSIPSHEMKIIIYGKHRIEYGCLGINGFERGSQRLMVYFQYGGRRGRKWAKTIRNGNLQFRSILLVFVMFTQFCFNSHVFPNIFKPSKDPNIRCWRWWNLCYFCFTWRRSYFRKCSSLHDYQKVCK